MSEPMRCLRRQPQQQRSRERVNAILDAAGLLLAEAGPAATTITAVAERSGLATSSVYDYVEDERQLIGAVAERGLSQVHGELAALVGESRSLEELLDAMVASLRMFLSHYRATPGMREALAFANADPELAMLNVEDTRRNAALLTERMAPFRPGAELSTTMLLLTHFGGALGTLALLSTEQEATVLIADFERMLHVLLSDSASP